MKFAVSSITRLIPYHALFGVFSFLSIAPSAYALEEKVLPEKTLPQPPVGAGELANITLGLVLVLALIFALAWLFRRYGNVASLNRSNIQVLGGVSLGSRERAVVLEVEGEQILVGVTPSQITRLHVLKSRHLSDSDAADIKSQPLQADNTEDFASKLQAEQQYSTETKP